MLEEGVDPHLDIFQVGGGFLCNASGNKNN
jgi:hypothetical protein